MAMRILATTPIFKTPAAIPHRYVLVEETHNCKNDRAGWEKGDINQYVVYRELFLEDEPHTHLCYVEGHYYIVAPNQTNKEESFRRAYYRWVTHVSLLEDYIRFNPSSYEIILPTI